MANFIITSSPDSTLVEIDGKKAAFQSGDIHPYTADGAGDTVFLYETKGILNALGRSVSVNNPNLSRDRIPITIGTDNINVDGVTVFADADALLEALREVFFLARPDSPLIPDGQRVDTFANLPDPTINDGEYWVVDQPTGTWILGTRREAGIYKAVSGVWVYRGADVPYYLLDDQFTIKDGTDNTKQLGFEVDNVTPGQRRIATWQDKDITVAGLDDLQIIKYDIVADFQLPENTTFPSNALIRCQNRSGATWVLTTTGVDTIEGEVSVEIFDQETFDFTLTGADFRL